MSAVFAIFQWPFCVLVIVQVTSSPKPSVTAEDGAGTDVVVPVFTQLQIDAE